MRMALLVGALGLGIVGAGFAGCQSARPPAELATEMEAGPLAFLQDGQTSREQVLLRLGIPTADFEGQRILTYRLYYDPEHGVQVLPRDRLIGTEETVWTGVSACGADVP